MLLDGRLKWNVLCANLRSREGWQAVPTLNFKLRSREGWQAGISFNLRNTHGARPRYPSALDSTWDNGGILYLYIEHNVS